MRSVRLSLLAATAALALAAPACALAGPADYSASRAYLQADYALVHAATMRLKAVEHQPFVVLDTVQSKCPLAAAGSPQDPQSTQLSDEVIGAMVIAAYHFELPAMNAFVHAARGLRWSSSALTSAAHGYVSHMATLAALAPPALCADVRAWASSGFRRLPASTVRFDAAFMPAWVAFGVRPPGLSAYEDGAARSLAARVQTLEEQIAEVEARAVETWGKIMNALELNP